MTRLLYFAWIRERVGKPEETLALPASLATVADLLAWLRTRGPEYDHAFANAAVVRTAIDKAHVKPSTPIAGAREIAFFPPMTGG